ncbi:MAG: hypothetical protein J6C95_05505 [Muribaculaceae bacterium]|nr:hypothetical protein [Muribaculaceae bacterium]
MEPSKVVHVHFKEPYEGMTDLYFSSLKAIYQQVPEDIIGIKYKSLTNAVRGKDCYENKSCIIRSGALQRMSNNKSKDKQ